MNILHIILFSAIPCTLITHFIESKNIKLSIRVLMAIFIYIAGLSVFDGYQFNYKIWDLKLSEYLPLKITYFKWFCYLIPTLLIIYQYTKKLIEASSEEIS